MKAADFYRAGLAVMRDGRLLMVRKRGSDYWNIPGGRVEAGETIRQALEREVREELGVSVEASTLRELGVFKERATDSDGYFRLTLFVGDIVGNPGPAAEIEEIIWFDGTPPHSKLPPMFVNHVRPALETAAGWLSSS